MDARTRITLLTGGSILAVLLAAYGIAASFSWRSTQLASLESLRPPPRPERVSNVPLAAPLQQVAASEPTPRGLSNPTDADRDGLPDNLETIYKTDPHNKDTDGDGYPDGSEVANGYDPTVQSPNDKITIPVATPHPPTYTELYFDRVGLSPSRENLLKSGELEQFVAEANALGFLPAIRDEDLRIVPGSGRRVVAAYLDAVSYPQNKALTPVQAEQIEPAFRALTTQNDPKPLDALIASLGKNVEILQKAPVPQEALALHKHYLAATLALKQNIEMFKNYQTDFVGVLVAASRIDNLRSVFQAVAEGIRDLEKKYNIT